MTAWVCSTCSGENPRGTRFCGHCGRAAEQDEPQQDLARQLRRFVAGPLADRLEQAGGRLVEERRLVTAVFADISGFTQLADRLDPEELLQVVDPVIAGLTSIVGSYEGYVEKFAGDALLALFGAPVSHEDDPERALLAALDMRRELQRLREVLPLARELELHVGVNSGHAIARVIGSEVRTDYAVLGDSVILAQRLESAAPAGEIYVGDATYRLVKHRFDLAPVGEVAVKGRLEPVVVWRLVGERLAVAPGARARRMVGRARELDAVKTVFGEVAAGRRATLAILGEPGVGKSRLREEARRHVERQGGIWLEGRCLSYGGGIPYWPYIEVVRGLLHSSMADAGDTAGDRIRAGLDAIGLLDEAPIVERLLGFGGGSDGLDPESFRRRFHELVAKWLRALASKSAVVLALEDVHWLDASSRVLTNELARSADLGRVLICVTGRTEATELAEELDAEMCVLEALGAGHIAELAESFLEGRPPAELLPALAERSGGNPFFLEELLRAMTESGALELRDRQWTLGDGSFAQDLPATIEGVVSGRIDALPEPATRSLQAASVIGRSVRLPVLFAIEPASSPAIVSRLTDAGFLDQMSDETVSFHHALVQEVAYARLLRRQRTVLHRRVAEAAEEMYGAGDEVIDLLARHLYLGEAGPIALEYVLRAARRSRTLFANSEAIVQLTWAVDLVEKHPELDDRFPEIKLELAEVHELVGDYDTAHLLFREVQTETGDVRAWRGLASTLRKQGDYDHALEVVDEGLEHAGTAGADLRPLWLERASALVVSGRMEQAIAAAQHGLELEEPRDLLAGELLLKLAEASAIEGRLEDAVGFSLEAKRVFEGGEDGPRLATALRVLGDAYRELGRLDDAAETLRSGAALAERVGGVEELGGCLLNLAIVEALRGSLDEAIEIDRRATAEFERVGHGSGRVTGWANLAEMQMLKGDEEEALETASFALSLADEIGHTFMKPHILKTIATLRLRRGDAALAGEQAEEAARAFDQIGAGAQAVECLELAADAWKQADEHERADTARARARTLTSS